MTARKMTQADIDQLIKEGRIQFFNPNQLPVFTMDGLKRKKKQT
jgi:hypothetical protein